jgi:hypothetical protein
MECTPAWAGAVRATSIRGQPAGVALAAQTLSRADAPEERAEKLRAVANAFDAVGASRRSSA